MQSSLYNALGEGQIRLFRLYCGDWQDTIRGELYAVQLPSASSPDVRAPVYTALSYVWGHPKFDKTIIVNGLKFEITLNLHTALQRCRDTRNHVELWGDQICINQKAVDERSHQVTFMRMTFKLASKVFAYLGEHVSNAGRTRARAKCVTLPKTSAMSSLALTQPVKKRQREPFEVKMFQFLSALETDHHYTGSYLLLSDVEESQRLYEAIRKFTCSAWWMRMWIVQEVVIPSHVQLIYGSVRCFWSDMVKICKTWTSHATRCCRDVVKQVSIEYTKVLDRLASIVLDLEQIRTTYTAGLPQESSTVVQHQGLYIDDMSYFRRLSELLQKFRDRRASDERDKVYALLPLLHGDLRFPVDYSKSLEDVFISITYKIIQTTGSVECLRAVAGEKLRQSLPSWVPDWSASSTALVDGNSHQTTVYHGIEEYHRPLMHGSTLEIWGQCLGSVADSSSSTGTIWESTQERFVTSLKVWKVFATAQRASKVLDLYTNTCVFLSVIELAIQGAISQHESLMERRRCKDIDRILLLTWIHAAHLVPEDNEQVENDSINTPGGYSPVGTLHHPAESFALSESYHYVSEENVNEVILFLWDHIIKYFCRKQKEIATMGNMTVDQILHLFLGQQCSISSSNSFSVSTHRIQFINLLERILWRRYDSGHYDRIYDGLRRSSGLTIREQIAVVESSLASGLSNVMPSNVITNLKLREPLTGSRSAPCVLPYNAREGDLIVAAIGSQKPMVLRRVDHGNRLYTLVGHGHVHESLWQFERKGLRPEQFFVM